MNRGQAGRAGQGGVRGPAKPGEGEGMFSCFAISRRVIVSGFGAEKEHVFVRVLADVRLPCLTIECACARVCACVSLYVQI